MIQRKVPITERALLQRINRKLDKRDQKIHKARGMIKEQCDFYRLNTHTNTVVEYLNEEGLEKIGRELKVMQEFEKLASN
jgi:hypothetical protein